jgi:cytochrome P450
MQPLEERDYFTDPDIFKDPYTYFEALRSHGPVYRQPTTGVVFVTGYEEALQVLRNTRDFSSAICVQGAGIPLPFEPEGEDITSQIDAHRNSFIGSNLLVTYDDRAHTFSRALLGRLFTPSRLKALEHYVTDLSEDLVKTAVARGRCELVQDIAVPFVTLVIADLLGVPANDRQSFMQSIASGPPPGSIDAEEQRQATPLEFLESYFASYVEERRRAPRSDVLSELAHATFPDGSTPPVAEVASLASFLFGAGQDTSAKLLGNALKHLVDVPGLQDQVRQDLSLVPALLEEVLRIEGSTKMTNRVARHATRIGEVEIPVGTRIMIALAAANHDPRRWQDPQAFVLNRPRAIEHVGFGRGAHVCVGAPLARAELKILLEQLLRNTSNIDLVAKKHGPQGQRHFEYEPSFIIRGLENMHLVLEPAADFAPLDRPSILSQVRLARAEASDDDTPTRYSTSRSKIGVLLSNPQAKAVLVKHLPGVATDPRIGMAAGLTLRAVQSMAPDQFASTVLDTIDGELAQLPAPV